MKINVIHMFNMYKNKIYLITHLFTFNFFFKFDIDDLHSIYGVGSSYIGVTLSNCYTTITFS